MVVVGVRKKLLDLYQRYSASSYCTAFSYRPLLPDDTGSHSSDSTSAFEMNSDKALRLPASFGEKLSNQTGFLNHYEEFLLSTSDSDSSSVATLEWEKKSYDQAYRSPQEKRSLVLDNSFNLDAAVPPPSPPNDSEQIQNRLRLHTNQIFLGMISMQYRAKIDVIKLVEKLTKSCVRFVHFSSDNEQTSRVSCHCRFEKVAIRTGGLQIARILMRTGTCIQVRTRYEQPLFFEESGFRILE